MTLRTEAGERLCGRMREIVRDPTGSPVVGVHEAAENVTRALVEPGDAGKPLLGGWLGRDHTHGSNVGINLAEVNQRG